MDTGAQTAHRCGGLAGFNRAGQAERGSGVRDAA